MTSSASSRSVLIPLAVGFFLVLALPRPVLSVHLTDHRYTVWGEITYEDGSPAPGVTVRLTVEGGKPLGQTKTDARGRYRVLLHVHNQDLHKIFDMHVNNVSRKVRILFNPNDRSTERGERIDLTVERDAGDTTSRAPGVESTRPAGRAAAASSEVELPARSAL